MPDKRLTIHIGARDTASGVLDTIDKKLKQIRRTFGTRGIIKEITEVAIGAGAIGGVSFLTRVLGDAVERVRDVVDQFAAGKIGAGQLADELAKSVPILGNLYRAGKAFIDIISGQTAAAAKLRAELERAKAARQQIAATEQATRAATAGVFEATEARTLPSPEAALRKIDRELELQRKTLNALFIDLQEKLRTTPGRQGGRLINQDLIASLVSQMELVERAETEAPENVARQRQKVAQDSLDALKRFIDESSRRQIDADRELARNRLRAQGQNVEAEIDLLRERADKEIAERKRVAEEIKAAIFPAQRQAVESALKAEIEAIKNRLGQAIGDLRRTASLKELGAEAAARFQATEARQRFVEQFRLFKRPEFTPTPSPLAPLEQGGSFAQAAARERAAIEQARQTATIKKIDERMQKVEQFLGGKLTDFLEWFRNVEPQSIFGP